MTAEVHAFARPGSVGRPPLVPAKAILKDGAKLQTDPDLFESRWYRSCSPMQALAGLALRARSVKQEPAGSFPDDDIELAYLADFGRDVDGWKAAKAKVLEGWVLCADDRWHHPELARNVLHIWLGRLDTRRVSAWANASKGKDGGDYGLGSILDDIDDALAALRALDPQDAVLRKATKVASDWRKRVTEFFSPTEAVPEDRTAAPIRTPNGPPIRGPQEGNPKRSEAKVSEANVDSDMPGRRPGHDLQNQDQEIEKEQGTPPTPDEIRAIYPPDAFEQFYDERYPLKVGRKRAKEAFAAVQAKGEVPFPVLMDGLARYLRAKPPNQDWCHPVTWLNQERWADGAAASAAPSGAGPPVANPTVWVDADTPKWRAHVDAARRQGRPGVPRRDHPHDSRRRGWLFETEWPPGVDPADYGGQT